MACRYAINVAKFAVIHPQWAERKGANILKKNKYRSKKVIRDGMTFDSIKEYQRFCELRLLERAGAITNLERQVPFELIPAQYHTFARYGKRGQRIKDGKRCIEKAAMYHADFVYIDTETGMKVVEDVKSEATKTKDYILRRKLMLYVHGIIIKEV